MAVQGFRRAVLTDVAVAYKAVLSVPVLVIAVVQHQWINFGLLLVTTMLVLMAEIFNTAMEALCDVVEPAPSEAIGAIKDMTAAAVGLGIVAWIGILSFELLTLF
ncbi:MAG: diacylglycerol kinase [Cyanobacteriota bacterium]